MPLDIPDQIMAQLVSVSLAQKLSAEFLGTEQVVRVVSVFGTGPLEFGKLRRRRFSFRVRRGSSPATYKVVMMA